MNIFGTINETLPSLEAKPKDASQSNGVFDAIATTAPQYFYAKTDDQGGAIGYSQTEKDTSGRPFLAFRNPGDTATTTDKMRVATTFDPRVAKPLTHDEYYNPRAEGLRDKLKEEMGIAYNEELDHQIALALSGSNDRANLKDIPKSDNREAGTLEAKLARQVAKGEISMFDAQMQDAKQKGFDVAYPPTQKEPSVWHTIGEFLRKPASESIFGSTVQGLPQAAVTVGTNIVEGLKGQLLNPDQEQLDYEKKMGLTDTPGKLPQKYNPIRYALRLVAPALRPFGKDIAELTALHEKGGILDQVVEGKMPRSVLDEMAVLQKTAPQIVGDVAQTVLSAYGGGEGANVLGKSTAQPIMAALRSGFESGGVIGTLFGLAQAGSSGSTNLLEILGMTGTGTAVGGSLGLFTGGAVPVAKEVLSGLEKAKAFYDTIPNKQGGFAKNPFAETPKPEVPKQFHGTAESFNQFDSGKMTDGNLGKGIYITENEKLAQHYSLLANESKQLKAGSLSVDRKPANVLSVEVSPSAKIKSLDHMPSIEEVNAIKKEGYDGISYIDETVNALGEWDVKQLGLPPEKPRATIVFDAENVKVNTKDGLSTQPEVFYHGTTKADAESLVKNGWNPDLSTQSYKEAPYALFTSTERGSNSDHFAGTYGDTVVEVKPKQGEAIKVLDQGPDWQKYNETFGSSRNTKESAAWAAKLKEEGYDVIKEVSGETVILSPEKFDYSIPSKPLAKSAAPGGRPLLEQTKEVPKPVETAPAKPQEIASYKKDTTELANSKVNVSTFNVSQEGKALIEKTVEEIKPQIEKSIGARLTNKEAITLAEKSSKILDNAVSREKTIEWEGAMLRTRQALAKAAESGKVDREFVDALRTIKAQGTDIARKLQSLSILADPKDITGKQAIIEAVLKVSDNTDEILKQAKGVDFTNLNQATEFYRKFVAPKASEWLDLIRYNSMLSSPKTHIINVFSNAINSTIVPVLEKAVAGGVDFITSAFTGKRTAFAGEAGAYAKNYLKNTGEAFKRFADVMAGKRVFTNLDTKGLPIAVRGVKGAIVKALSLPMRLLESMDQFFTALTEGGELGALKYRRSKGVNVGNIETQAIEKALYRLYREGLNPETQGYVLDAIDKVTSMISAARNSENPIVSTVAKFTVPFLKTPMNIFKQGIEYSPAGFSTLLGAKNKIEQVSKALIGSTVFAGAATMLLSGRLSWAEPINPKEKAQFRADGKQPYSMKIGNNWVSYQKLPPPVAFPFAMAAAIDDSIKNRKLDDNTVDTILTSVSKYGQFLADQSYMKSIGDLLTAFKGGESSIEQVISNYPQQLIPYRAMSGWIARLMDTVQRKVDNKASFIDKQVQLLMMNIPGLSDNVPARLSPTGEPIKQQHPFINAVSPVGVSTEKGGSGPALPPLPKLPSLKGTGPTLKGQNGDLPKLPALNGPTSKSSARTTIARLLGINTAYASTVEPPKPETELIKEDQYGSVSRVKQSWWKELINGKKVVYGDKTPEETGKWLADHGQAIPGEFTMYNPSKNQTDATPKIMASGKKLYEGAIATSDYTMPLGTKVYVPELDRVYTVEDRMNRRYSPHTYGKTVFDIPTLEATSTDVGNARKFGRQQLHFVIVGHDGRKETKAEKI